MSERPSRRSTPRRRSPTRPCRTTNGRSPMRQAADHTKFWIAAVAVAALGIAALAQPTVGNATSIDNNGQVHSHEISAAAVQWSCGGANRVDALAIWIDESSPNSHLN